MAEPASRTSNILARLWLRRWNLRPETMEGDPDPAVRLQEGDATVVIGDDALFWEEETEERIDLGGAWTEWTGLPFVFALWAGPGAGDPSLARALQECHRRNAARLDGLARLAAPHDSERQGRVETYLGRCIRYRLGAREEKGLHRFLEMAAEAGLLRAAGDCVSHVDAR
jgi:chorismate dehydratase